MKHLDGWLRNASNNGEIARVQSLLGQGADPDAVNRQGETALHVALASGRHDIAGILLEAGASIDVESKRGWTPLAFAAAHEDLEAVELMVEARDLPVEALNECLTWAIRTFNPDLVALLLARGAEANPQVGSGMTLIEMVEASCHRVIADYVPRCRKIVGLLKRWRKAGVP